MPEFFFHLTSFRLFLTWNTLTKYDEKSFKNLSNLDWILDQIRADRMKIRAENKFHDLQNYLTYW